MTSNSLRVVLCLVAVAVATACAPTACAFCGTCGGGGAVAYAAPTTYAAAYAPAYTTAYAPTYTTAYQPVAYTANYGSGGWWPGCCLGRLFGWQSNYAVSYAPATYAVSYAPACTTCAPACTTCASPCTTCASPCTSCVQQVSMRPVCATDCASCGGCASCSNGTVTQAVYQGSTGCSSCAQPAAATTIVIPSGQAAVSPGTTTGGQPQTSGGQAPELAPGEQVPPRTFQKMMNENGDVEPEPVNGDAPAEATPTNGGDSNANYFEAPKLFNANDRSAARIAAPVRNAVYERPAAYRQVSVGRITAAQAQQDATGWTSASH